MPGFLLGEFFNFAIFPYIVSTVFIIYLIEDVSIIVPLDRIQVINRNTVLRFQSTNIPVVVVKGITRTINHLFHTWSEGNGHIFHGHAITDLIPFDSHRINIAISSDNHGPVHQIEDTKVGISISRIIHEQVSAIHHMITAVPNGRSTVCGRSDDSGAGFYQFVHGDTGLICTEHEILAQQFIVAAFFIVVIGSRFHQPGSMITVIRQIEIVRPILDCQTIKGVAGFVEIDRSGTVTQNTFGKLDPRHFVFRTGPNGRSSGTGQLVISEGGLILFR